MTTTPPNSPTATREGVEERARKVLAEHVAPGWRGGILSGKNIDWGHVRPSEAIRAMLAFAQSERLAERERAARIADEVAADCDGYPSVSERRASAYWARHIATAIRSADQ